MVEARVKKHTFKVISCFAHPALTNCLKFDAGTIITVKWWTTFGWWWGELDGKEGWFPSAFTQPYISSGQDSAILDTPKSLVGPPLPSEATRTMPSPKGTKSSAGPWNLDVNASYKPRLDRAPGKPFSQTAVFNRKTGVPVQAEDEPDPLADLDPAEKAAQERGMKQLTEFFDFDSWNDQMNKQKRKKATISLPAKLPRVDKEKK
eukprot:Filipodium_phascolosomae@DN3366_c0_g1_i1.p1